MVSAAQMAASAALGAFIGYVTNAIAIHSLFRPLQPHWYSLGWQGVIPRNRHKLARNIARVVGEDLLHPSYVVAQLERPELQDGLRRFAGERLEQALGAEISSLFEALPLDWQEGGLQDWVSRGLQALVEWSSGAAGTALRAELLERAERHVRALRLGDLLGPQHVQDMAEHLGAGLAQTEARDHLAAGLRQWLDSYLGSDEPLENVVPEDLRRLLHERMRSHVPVLLQRLAAWLSSPENVEHISQRIFGALESQTEEEGGLLRIVGGLGLALFSSEIQAAVREGVPRLAHDYLHSPQTQQRVETQLVESLNGFLQRPLAQVLGGHRAEVVERVASLLAAWATSEQTQQRLVGLVLREYHQRADRSLAGLLPESSWPEIRARLLGLSQPTAEQATRWAVPLSAWLRVQLRQSHARLRQCVRLTQAAEAGLVALGVERAMELLRAELPVLVQQLDVEAMVERKIGGFDLLRVERLVRSIVAEQLQYINLTGAVLGGLIGLGMPFVNALLARSGL